MSAKTSTFEKDGKSFPTLELKYKDEDKYGLTVGVSKAKLILNHIEEIKKFVDRNART